MFKNAQQRKMLFAMDKDAQKGTNPMGIKTHPSSINTTIPGAQIHPVPQTSNIGLHQPMPMHPAIPHMGIPHQGLIQPTAIPSLPGLEKLPKFGRVKKLLVK